MSSDNSLRDVLVEAIQGWAAENDGGFATAFVIALDYVDASGDNMTLVSEMDNQSTPRSMGLVTYLDTWYKDDAVQLWKSLWGDQ